MEQMQLASDLNLVDSFNKENSVAHLLVRESNVFCAKYHLQEPGLVEHFIQSASKAIESDFSINEIKDFSISFLPKIGETLKTKVKIQTNPKGGTVVAAVTEIDGVVAAKCKLKVNLSNTNN
ncbi:MAG: hypothetical protein J6R14_02245 [Bacteroidales bacterium]|jgi:hypothetical protein|nr:hypothetical protein [Bacteroidales bacterium]MBO7305572.1 hypothetical protein [Bacteroidales bacterium]MBQ1218464.1 hypothetical protein [Bacteroidales bacterium]MBQ1930145.1 hypothetical protein [Bacteroidales bacterium]MBQ5593401.1 hypothetical protein [Bacteroidales bacterium]